MWPVDYERCTACSHRHSYMTSATHVCRYVTRKDPHRNAVYVSRQYHEHAHRRDAFTCGPISWCSAARPDPALPLFCKASLACTFCTSARRLCVCRGREVVVFDCLLLAACNGERAVHASALIQPLAPPAHPWLSRCGTARTCMAASSRAAAMAAASCESRWTATTRGWRRDSLQCSTRPVCAWAPRSLPAAMPIERCMPVATALLLSRTGREVETLAQKAERQGGAGL